ncbi:MAG: right-handed parallel beta-helix repeat-containing protein [Geminicoccaceae bacterium]|nr:right-handed parallel beta-helix repeat-containing protein [Geminicoccaceae bacterium]MCX7630814.1 right-handed parallel beta-helix repeat-containing protein [Geminicoccaceae bacterium]MDW8340893.1 right-handed parallel beta-helix repeat-containing protein [Geminicoccaceae bacterium]
MNAYAACVFVFVLALAPAAMTAPSCTPAEVDRDVLRVPADPQGSPEPILRALATARGRPSAIVVELEGTFFLDRPLELGPEHAGLVMRASARGARLVGGIPLATASWRRAPDGALELELADPRLPEGPLDLHLDGTRLEPARHPDGDPADPRAGWLFTAAGTDGARAFYAHPSDLAPLPPEPGLSVLIYDAPQWATNFARVARFDPRTGLVELADNVDWHRLGPGTPYRFSGSRRFLDRPGEWHFDPRRRVLALRLPDERGLAGRRLVASVLDSLLLVRRTQAVTIRGLELVEGSPRGSDRIMPWNHIGGGAIRVENARGIALCGNRIRDVGVGIALLSVEDALVAENRIQRIAGNGIYLGMPWGGRPSREVRIEANRIEDVGHRFADSAGILVQGATRVEVRGNRIARSAQFGIYLAQTRPNGEDRIRSIRVEGNLVRDSNLRTADGGGIKLFAAVQDEPMDVAIRANWIDGTGHFMAKPDGRFFSPEEFDPEAWPQPVSLGIYLDWYARGVLVESNLLTRTYGGIAIVNGSDNRIRFNYLSGGPAPALVVDDKTASGTERPRMVNNRFEGNVVVRDRPGSLAVSIWDPGGSPDNARFAGNVYTGPAFDARAFRVAPVGLPGGARRGDLALWQQSRYVAGREHAHEFALVFDPARGELRLSPRAAAARLGIPEPPPALLALLRDPR